MTGLPPLHVLEAPPAPRPSTPLPPEILEARPDLGGESDAVATMER